MIVISGALAVVAFVLLIAGLVADGLELVYASIAVSLVSAIFLGVGAFQRRGEEVAPRAEPAPSPGFAAEPVRIGAAADDVPADEATVRIAASGDTSGGTVLVVPGRPRYHVEGCRYLAGKDGETRSLAEARNEGYTACGICRPDENIGATLEPAFVGAGADEEDTEADDEFDYAPAHTETRRAPQRRTAARKTAAKRATVKKATVKKATAKKTTAKKTTAKKATATRGGATRSAAKKTTAKKTAARSTAKKTAAKKSTAKKTAKRTRR